jgi:hemoglobin
MNISESDWQIFLQHAGATMNALNLPQQEQTDIFEFVASFKEDRVEVD